MKAYKFRLYPSAEHEMKLNDQLNLCRELYNAFLQQRIYAYRMGIKINYNNQQNQIPDLVFPEEKLESEVDRIVGMISDKPSDAVYLAKMAVNLGSEINPASALEYEGTVFGLLFSTDETKKRVSEFLQRKGTK